MVIVIILHYFHIKNKINKLQYQCENIALINQLKYQTSQLFQLCKICECKGLTIRKVMGGGGIF